MIALYKESFLEVGYIRKGHGYQGHAKIVLYNGYEEDVSQNDFLFFEIDGYHVPFHIEERQLLKELVLKFQFIDSVEELKKFQGTRLFLLQKDVTQQKVQIDEYPSKSLKGYRLIDINTGDVGQIIRVDTYPQQEMAIVIIDNKEVLIPLHPELIESLDEKERWIKMQLPGGILNI